MQGHRHALLQSLALLHLGQIQQAFDQLLQALAFSRDVADEARTLLGGHLAFEQLCGATDRRQRALQFVGQGVHVALDVILALQLHTHALHGAGQLRHLAPAIARQFRAAPFADRLGVAGQAIQRAAQPPGQPRADQQAEHDQPRTEPREAPLRTVDIGLQRAVGFGDRNHADDLLAIADRRGDIHHRGFRVVRRLAAGTRAVLAAQGQVDVVPARVVLAHGLAEGIQQDDAARVGHVDAVVHRGLVHAPDVRLRAARAIGAKHLGQAALVEGAALHVGLQNLGQQVGGIHQGLFAGLAHAGADLVHHRAQYEPAGQPDEEEVDQEDPQRQAHQLLSGA